MSGNDPPHLRLLEAILFAAEAPLSERVLASRLPEDVDLGALQKSFLFGTLQQQSGVVDTCNRLPFPDGHSGFCDHLKLTGNACGYLQLISTVNGARYGDGWCDLDSDDFGYFEGK